MKSPIDPLTSSCANYGRARLFGLGLVLFGLAPNLVPDIARAFMGFGSWRQDRTPDPHDGG